MSSTTLEILIILVLIIANGVFSMSEMAVVSARKVRLQQLANQGDAKARAALKLAESPNQFLSTVQVGITLIGISDWCFRRSYNRRKTGSPCAAYPLLSTL